MPRGKGLVLVVPVVSLLWLLLTACPPSTKPDTTARPCAKEGDACLVSPGKLGTCVSKPSPCETSGAETRAESCFSCQSQH